MTGRPARRDDPAWRMVWTLAVTETISYGVLLYAFAVFLLPMRTSLHASVATVSVAFSISVAVSGAAAIPVGVWVDHHGARGLMTTGSALAAVSVVGWSSARTTWQLDLAFVGIGIAAAAITYDPAFAAINRLFGTRRNAPLLVVTVVAGFASTVTLPTAQALISALGWRTALLVLAAAVAVTAVLHAAAIPRIQVAKGSSLAEAAPGPDARAALSFPPVRALTVATVAGWASATLVIVYLVAYLRSRGYPAGEAAIAAGALGIMSVSGRVAMTRLARRAGVARVAAWMVAGQAVGIGALAWFPRPSGVVVFVVLYGAGFGVLTIARPALLGELVPSTVFARVSGVQAMVATLGRIAAPIAGGAIIAADGYRWVLALAAGASLAAASALVVTGRRSGLLASPDGMTAYPCETVATATVHTSS